MVTYLLDLATRALDFRTFRFLGLGGLGCVSFGSFGGPATGGFGKDGGVGFNRLFFLFGFLALLASSM